MRSESITPAIFFALAAFNSSVLPASFQELPFTFQCMATNFLNRDKDGTGNKCSFFPLIAGLHEWMWNQCNFLQPCKFCMKTWMYWFWFTSALFTSPRTWAFQWPAFIFILVCSFNLCVCYHFPAYLIHLYLGNESHYDVSVNEVTGLLCWNVAFSSCGGLL